MEDPEKGSNSFYVAAAPHPGSSSQPPTPNKRFLANALGSVPCLLHAPLCVRPHLAESTVSRPICEVKQLQAQLVLRSGMTRELWVSHATPTIFPSSAPSLIRFSLFSFLACLRGLCAPRGADTRNRKFAIYFQLTQKKLQFLYYIGMISFLVTIK